MQWLDLPADPCTPLVHGLRPRPTFIVVHLFAGRRRETDLHAWLDHWAHRHNFDVMVLSMDTAISPVLGQWRILGAAERALPQGLCRRYDLRASLRDLFVCALDGSSARAAAPSMAETVTYGFTPLWFGSSLFSGASPD